MEHSASQTSGGAARAVQRSKWGQVARIIAASCRTRVRFALGRIDSFSGSTMQRLQVAQSVAYIHEVYRDFVEYGKLTPEAVRGKSLLEYGPGDNVGVALRFLASGAREARCLDKFYSSHDVGHERAIYVELRRQLSDEEKRNFDDAVSLEGGLQFNPERISYVYGYGAQEADKAFGDRTFDIIFSRGVMQEVHRTDRAFRAMDRLLAPGGRIAHKIDLRDYGMFSGLGFHPREFLTLPDPIYWLMAYESDKPNRHMLDYYRAKMQELGWDAEFYITGIVDHHGYSGMQREIVPHKKKLEFGVDYAQADRALVEEIRPRLASRYRHLSEEDLLAAAVFLTAVKPAR